MADTATTLHAIFNGFSKTGAEAVSIYNQQRQQQVDNRHREVQLDQNQQKIDLAREAHEDAVSYRERVYQDTMDDQNRNRIRGELYNTSGMMMQEMKKLGVTDRQAFFRENPDSDKYLAAFMKARFPKVYGADSDIYLQRDGQGNYNIYGRGPGQTEFQMMQTMTQDEVLQSVNVSIAKFGLVDFFQTHGVKPVKNEEGKTVFVGKDDPQLSPEVQQALAEQNQNNVASNLPPLNELADMDDPSTQFLMQFEKQFVAPRYLQRDQTGLNLKDAFEAKLYNPDPVNQGKLSAVEEYEQFMKELQKGSTFTKGFSSPYVKSKKHRELEAAAKAELAAEGKLKDHKDTLASHYDKHGSLLRTSAYALGTGARGLGQAAVGVAKGVGDLGSTIGSGLADAFSDEDPTADSPAVAESTKNAATKAATSPTTGKNALSETDVAPNVKAASREAAKGMEMTEQQDFLMEMSVLSQTDAGKQFMESKAFLEVLKQAGKGVDGTKAVLDLMLKEAQLNKALMDIDDKGRQRYVDNAKHGVDMLTDFFKQYDSTQGSGKSRTGGFSIGQFSSAEQAAKFSFHQINNNAEYLRGQGVPMLEIPTGNKHPDGSPVVFSVMDASRMTPAMIDHVYRQHLKEPMERHGSKAWWKFGDKRDESGKVDTEGVRKEDPMAAYLGMSPEKQAIVQKDTGKTHDELLQQHGGQRAQ